MWTLIVVERLRPTGLSTPERAWRAAAAHRVLTLQTPEAAERKAVPASAARPQTPACRRSSSNKRSPDGTTVRRPAHATGISLDPYLRAPGLQGLDARAAARAAEARVGQRVGAQAVVAEAVPAGARRERHQHVARAADRARLPRLCRRGCPREPGLLRRARPCTSNRGVVLCAMTRTAHCTCNHYMSTCQSACLLKCGARGWSRSEGGRGFAR